LPEWPTFPQEPHLENVLPSAPTGLFFVLIALSSIKAVSAISSKLRYFLLRTIVSTRSNAKPCTTQIFRNLCDKSNIPSRAPSLQLNRAHSRNCDPSVCILRIHSAIFHPSLAQHKNLASFSRCTNSLELRLIPPGYLSFCKLLRPGVPHLYASARNYTTHPNETDL
jgi:hypothetical protein